MLQNQSSEEETTLSAWLQSPTKVLINFCLLSICFGITLGCANGLLTLASANLGANLAGTQSGVLFVSYTLSALLTATGMVQKFGAKNVLNMGLCLYCSYVGSFLLLSKFPDYSLVIVVVGSCIGGLGVGWAFSAQVYVHSLTFGIIYVFVMIYRHLFRLPYAAHYGSIL